ncbi:rod-determining factor RdfA [Natrinema halophilum]|uniref:rod-determining factor RdfA n=1 Tax=Natrinema halophilum TaxID=1699371 RepID=UPI001F2D8B93|nr:rod-determining factor RdfA [Natrinema halophilum]UHQ96225.1 hypothetical protein HYG82_23290 [Natrinema halophilum]
MSSGARTEARAHLEYDGIDVDRLESDFVTYQAIRTYLKEHRDAEYDSSSEYGGVEAASNSINRLRSRVRSVVDGTLERLTASDLITLGEYRLFVNVEVLCTDCGTQHSVVDLLQRGGCNCDEQSRPNEK